jgi:hypothetical protein
VDCDRRGKVVTLGGTVRGGCISRPGETNARSRRASCLRVSPGKQQEHAGTATTAEVPHGFRLGCSARQGAGGTGQERTARPPARH